jgi:O-antigen/teichoic acid export membrane protein
MKKDRNAKDVIGILVTRVAWSAMGIVSGVILARWLGPHDRGVLALVLLIPSTVVTVVKLGMSQSNVYYINRERSSASAVASNAVVFAVWSGLAAMAAVWMLRDNLMHDMVRDVPDWALALALVRVPLLLIDNSLFGVLQATGKFGVYNWRLVFSEALRLVMVIIALVFFNMGLFAAVLIYTFVNFCNVAWLAVSTYRQIPFGWKTDRALLVNQLSFGVRSWLQVVTAHLLLRVDIYMVSHYLGPDDTAFYALALHFTEMVLEVPQAIGLVLFPQLASLPEKEVHRLTAQTCRRTLVITAPAALALGLLGPYVITLWYGEPYAPAGGPLPYAAIGVAMMSIFVILTRDFTSRGYQAVNIVAGLLALASNIALNTVMIPAYGIVGASQATAISYTGACVILLVFFLASSRIPLTKVLIPTAEDARYFRQTMTRLLGNARLPIFGNQR